MADHAHESIVIQGDPATVMAVIADFSAYPQWAGPVKRTEVLEPGDDGRARKVKIDVELLGLSDSYVNEYAWDGDTYVSWTMLEGRSQKSQVGSYTLEPSGKDTTVTYDLTVELAIPVPGLIRRRIQSKVVDAALKDLKKRVEG
ncbi:MAG TPA: SRPBCC family protein [Frankiaceae bacterium]|nr:SRPBCC family protein [Frankiaceae bacterium]